MRVAVSQVCTLPASFASELDDYAASGCDTIELWLTKVEQHLQEAPGRTATDVVRALADRGITAPVASFQGGLLSSQGEARRVAWDLFQRRLALCRALGVAVLVVACDVPAPLDATTLERVQVSLVEAARLAESADIRLALEFQHQAAIGNNLQTAAALVAEAGSRHLGICLDLFHFHVGPSKTEDLGLLTRDILFHVQWSDLADIPRELARDAQRILPGDGEIPTAALAARLRELDYPGVVAVELLNPRLWQLPPRQLVEASLAALRRVV